MVELPGVYARVRFLTAFLDPRRIIVNILRWCVALLLLGGALSASAAISYVQGNTNGISSGTTASISYAGAQTAGDTNIIVVSWYDTSPRVVSVTDTEGNVYSLAISTSTSPDAGGGTTSVYYAKNIAAAAANANMVTVMLDSSEPYVELSITEFSGIDTVNPLDMAVGATGTGTVADSGAATTNNASDLLLGNAYVAQWADAPDSGYTKLFQTFWGDAVEAEAVTAAGSYSASFTQNASGWWVMQMVAFKASSDTQAPTAPANLTATATSSSQVNLTWTASTDNVGVAGYEVERCSGATCSTFAQIASPTITSYSDAPLSASTSYSYRVRATDAAGNLSGYSNISSATTASYAAPVIQYIQGNTNGLNPAATVSTTYTSAQTVGDTNIVVVSWYDTDPRGVSVTDSMGNVYTRAIQTAGPSGSGEGTTSVYYAKNIAAAAANANTVTVTLDGSEPFVELSIAEYSGIDPVNPLDVAVGAMGINSLADSGYTTIVNANDLLFGNAYVGSWADAAGAGYTQRFITNFGDAVEDEVVTGTGTYSASMTQQSSNWWIMQMVAFRAAGSQSSSDTTAPSAPTTLTATATSSTQITLTWNASTDNVGVTGYRVERCSGTSCATFAQIASPTTTSYSDTGLTASTSYSYRVRATDAAGNLSAYSSTVSATTQTLSDTNAPTAPTGLTVTASSDNEVDLAWNAASGLQTISSYQVLRCQGVGCSNFSLAASVTTLTDYDASLTAGTSYSYEVVAVDSSGNASAPSNAVTVTTVNTGTSCK